MQFTQEAFKLLPVPRDVQHAKTLVSEVVAEVGPDHRYIRDSGEDICHYTKNDKPACVVGRVLSKLGWPIEALKLMDAYNDAQNGGAPPSAEASDQTVFWDRVGRDTRGFLSDCQQWSDDGRPWGKMT